MLKGIRKLHNTIRVGFQVLLAVLLSGVISHGQNGSGLQFDVGARPHAVAFDGANIWTANHEGNNVTKLRASDGACVGICTFAVGTRPIGVAFDGTSIWVANQFSNNVTKLRASDGACVGICTFTVGANPFALAFDGTNIWVTNTGSSNVMKLQASDGALLETFNMGIGPAYMAFDGANIWVAHSVANGIVTKLRASDGACVGICTFGVGSVPGGVAFDGANIWVANQLDNNVMKLRASDGACVGICTFGVGTNPVGVAFDGANIWVANNGSNNVKVLRASDGTVLETFTAGTHPWGVAFDGANIWVTNNDSNTVSKFSLPDQSELVLLGAGRFWIGLKNSDDQGTAFDLRAELYKNGVLITADQTLCITGVTRNPNLAKEVSILFGAISEVPLAAGDVLSLRVLTRIGTNPDGTKCPGHSNAVGLRLYYDSTNRPSRFEVEITPDPLSDFFLHSAGGMDFFDPISPTAGTAIFKDSASINFAGGNPWKQIGAWSRTQP